MAERIDVLAHQGTMAATFTVNTAVASVPLVQGAGAVNNFSLFEDRQGDSIFENGDNLLILSMGFTLPLGFELMEGDDGSFFLPFIETILKQNPSGAIIVPLPKMFMPLLNNYELSIGNWHDVPDVGPLDTGFEIWGRLPVFNPGELEVSMTNVPAAFEGLVFHCPAWIKVSHTLPLLSES